MPLLDWWRRRRAGTGGSDSARYCYSVWLRHLNILSSNGFCIAGSNVGELGPGDSIGIGLAALLSGAKKYTGLDIFPFASKADLLPIFREIAQLYVDGAPIPNQEEFPKVRPRLNSYAFPRDVIDWKGLAGIVETIKDELKLGFRTGLITYCAPWNSPDVIKNNSLDLVFSQAVLEHVDALEETYMAMSAWLKPNGYASHVIDFGAHHLSPFWNGHWAYGDFEWRLVRGRREFLLNRQPLSKHLDYARRAGFEVVEVLGDYDDGGLPLHTLAPVFRQLTVEDRRTRGAIVVLKKRN